MAKFKFNLEAVLKHRRFQEQEKQRALSVVRSQMTILENELKSLNETVQKSTDDLRNNRLVGRVDMSFIAAHRRFVFGMNSRAAGVVQQMAKLQTQVEAAQRALAEAAKARKIIEKLREKQFDRWRRDQATKELAALDEVGMQLSFATVRDDQVNAS